MHDACMYDTDIHDAGKYDAIAHTYQDVPSLLPSLRDAIFMHF